MNIAELSRDNPRLLELEEAYAKLNYFENSLWKTWVDHIDIQNFRGEPGYLSQMWQMTPERYQNTLHYAIDQGLRHDIEMLGEDGAFGCITFNEDMGASEDDIVYSRDLLDSVCEIQFLRETLGFKDTDEPTLLDIGAGYGRLAYRWLQAMPFAYVFCCDAIPLSTFLCNFYLNYRIPHMESATIPLHELSRLQRADVACNIHSFSEMPLSAVRFWLSFCADLNIPNLFLVPHAGDLIHPHFVTSEADGSHLDYFHLFAEHGYKLKVQRPKFPRELAPRLIYSTDYLLFERG